MRDSRPADPAPRTTHVRPPRTISVHAANREGTRLSVWHIERTGDRVRLTYTPNPVAERPEVRHCGEGDRKLEAELEAWVIQEASPWDLVRTARGTFARLPPMSADGPRGTSAAATATGPDLEPVAWA